MKNKNLLIFGALALAGVILYKKNEANRTASLEADDMSACSGCANASGTGTATPCKSPTNPNGDSCEDVCNSLGGTFDSGVGQFGGCVGAQGYASPLEAPRRSRSRGSFASANGWN